MANEWSDIEAALNQALVDEFGSDVTLIFENRSGDDGTAIEPQGTHIEAFFLPASTTNIEVGRNGKQRANGVYQVTIRVPLFSGTYEVNQLRDRLLTVYARGAFLTRNSTMVRVITASPASRSRSGNYYQMPVTIEWRADI